MSEMSHVEFCQYLFERMCQTQKRLAKARRVALHRRACEVAALAELREMEKLLRYAEAMEQL
jgi:hypothetical protein